MAYFAELDSDNKVLRTLLISNEVINNAEGLDGEELGIAFCKSLYGENTIWKQTSYNTKFSVHFNDRHEPDNGTPIRGNFAHPGMIYDKDLDAFYVKDSPYPSWVFDNKAFAWKAPVPNPQDGKFYLWDEPTLSWKLAVI